MKSTKQNKEPKIALYSELDEGDRFLHDCLEEREVRTMFIKRQLSSGWTKQKVLNLLRGLGFNY